MILLAREPLSHEALELIIFQKDQFSRSVALANTFVATGAAVAARGPMGEPK
jgi:hypothetical protein